MFHTPAHKLPANHWHLVNFAPTGFLNLDWSFADETEATLAHDSGYEAGIEGRPLPDVSGDRFARHVEAGWLHGRSDLRDAREAGLTVRELHEVDQILANERHIY